MTQCCHPAVKKQHVGCHFQHVLKSRVTFAVQLARSSPLPNDHSVAHHFKTPLVLHDSSRSNHVFGTLGMAFLQVFLWHGRELTAYLSFSDAQKGTQAGCWRRQGQEGAEVPRHGREALGLSSINTFLRGKSVIGRVSQSVSPQFIILKRLQEKFKFSPNMCLFFKQLLKMTMYHYRYASCRFLIHPDCTSIPGTGVAVQGQPDKYERSCQRTDMSHMTPPRLRVKGLNWGS